MEIVSFVLGAFIALVVLVGIEVFTTTNKLKKLEENFRSSEEERREATAILHRRIDGQTTGSYTTNREINSRIDDEVRELRAHNDQTLLRIEREISELHHQISKNKRIV